MAEVYNVQTTKRSGKVGRIIFSWVLFVFCVHFAIFTLFPIWLMLVNATRSTEAIRAGLSFFPSTHLFKNIASLLSNDFPIITGYLNSTVIALSSTVLSVYFSALTAYGFFMYKFRGRKILYAIVIGTILIPGQLGMIGWYQLVVDLYMYDTYIPLIVPGIAAAGTVFFLKQYFDANFSKEIIEAARIDGSPEFVSFNIIVVPLIMPALATMAIFSVIGSWNNYVGPLMILSTKEYFTMPMLVELLKTDIYKTDLGAIYAGILLTILPLMAIYFVFSRQIIRGVALGGLKE